MACGPSNCLGCCSSSGACVSGGSATQCGAGGLACVACGTGRTCASGTCQSPASCASTCAGCCVNEVCMAGTAPDACGKSGATCVACSACTNQVCSGAGQGVSGDPCQTSADCAPGVDVNLPLCNSEWLSDGGPTGWTGGYCTSFCFGSCPGNGLCASPVCSSRCSPANAGQGSCRAGYVCNGSLADGGGEGSCQRNCNNAGAGCTSGRTCNSIGYCN